MRKPYKKLHLAKTVILANKSHGEINFSTDYNCCEMHLTLHKANSNLQCQNSLDLMIGYGLMMLSSQAVGDEKGAKSRITLFPDSSHIRQASKRSWVKLYPK